MDDLLVQLNSQVEGIDKLRKKVIAHRNEVRKAISKQKKKVRSHQDCSAIWTAYVASVQVSAANLLAYQTSVEVSQSIYQQWYVCIIV